MTFVLCTCLRIILHKVRDRKSCDTDYKKCQRIFNMQTIEQLGIHTIGMSQLNRILNGTANVLHIITITF